MRPLLAVGLLLVAAGVLARDEAMRFELKVLPAFKRYSELLELPGYGAVLLENNRLSPSLSSKIRIRDHGRSAEIRNASLRFVRRKSDIFEYEAAYYLGAGETKIVFAVALDASALAEGKLTVVASPPLARFLPSELTDRIRQKTQLLANENAQKTIIEYLDRLSTAGNVTEAILIDAYNRSVDPVAAASDASEQDSDPWLLVLTLLAWLVVVPAWLMHRRRQLRKAA